jgi:hypothetical protein
MPRRRRARKQLTLDHGGVACVEALCPRCNGTIEQLTQGAFGRPVVHRTSNTQALKTYGPLAQQVREANRRVAQMFPATMQMGLDREMVGYGTGLRPISPPPPKNLEAAAAAYPGPRTQLPGLRSNGGVWRCRCRCGCLFAVSDLRLAELLADAISHRRGDFFLPRGRPVTGF